MSQSYGLVRMMVLPYTHGRDKFLYLSARKMVNMNTLLADRYKNLSLPCAYCNTLVPTSSWFCNTLVYVISRYSTNIAKRCPYKSGELYDFQCPHAFGRGFDCRQHLHLAYSSSTSQTAMMWQRLPASTKKWKTECMKRRLLRL